MRDIHMSIDEYLALTPEEKRKFTEVKIDFLYDEHRLQAECQKDHDDEREGTCR